MNRVCVRASALTRSAALSRLAIQRRCLLGIPPSTTSDTPSDDSEKESRMGAWDFAWRIYRDRQQKKRQKEEAKSKENAELHDKIQQEKPTSIADLPKFAKYSEACHLTCDDKYDLQRQCQVLFNLRGFPESEKEKLTTILMRKGTYRTGKMNPFVDEYGNAFSYAVAARSYSGEVRGSIELKVVIAAVSSREETEQVQKDYFEEEVHYETMHTGEGWFTKSESTSVPKTIKVQKTRLETRKIGFNQNQMEDVLKYTLAEAAQGVFLPNPEPKSVGE